MQIPPQFIYIRKGKAKTMLDIITGTLSTRISLREFGLFQSRLFNKLGCENNKGHPHPVEWNSPAN